MAFGICFCGGRDSKLDGNIYIYMYIYIYMVTPAQDIKKVDLGGGGGGGRAYIYMFWSTLFSSDFVSLKVH